MEKLTCDPFTELDEEILDDFFSCFREAAEEVELTIQELNKNRENTELIHKLFRAMHSLKGNCRMVFLDPLVGSTHELEEIVQEIRNDLFPYEEIFGEYMVACIEQLEIIVQDLIRDGSTDPERLKVIDDTVQSIRAGAPDEQAALTKVALSKLYDFAAGMQSTESNDNSLVLETDIDILGRITQRMVSLKLFDKQKFKSMIELAAGLNEDLDTPVDPEQLQAAVYMRVISKALRHRDEQGAPLAFQEDTFDAGYELLKFMPRWQVAQTIVTHLFENVDGSGPLGLKQDDIHPGGRIMKIIGHFTNVIANRGDSRFKKTLLRAVTDLNANVQINYDQQYVEAFNLLVRRKFIANR